VQTDHVNVARLEGLAALAGVMIALQSRANGELSHRLNNSLEAAFISFSSGLIVLIVIALLNSKVRVGIGNLKRALKDGHLPWWQVPAGVLGGTFVAFQTHVVPLIGVAIYSVASIAGQTGISLFVDRIGLTGGGKKPISKRRAAAAVVTVIAVLVSVLDKLDVSTFSIVAVLFSLGAGALVGVQRALNGQINEHTKQSYATSLLNFITGTTTLAIFWSLNIIFWHGTVNALPGWNILIYTGGTIGVIYIAFTSTIVQHLGVLTFTLFSTGGTLIGSLLIDWLIPGEGVGVSWYLIVGIAMTYLGVMIGGQSRIFKRS
jgi:transporter family-2 protein